jgi:hypothetical protein
MKTGDKKRGSKYNILDKTDRSTVKDFGNENLPASSKAQKFGWAPTAPWGEFRMIPKEQLNIDDRYQRREVSKAKVLDIARKWDPRLFCAISVVERGNGSYWVFEGGHRARAAFYRDDVTELPCMVFRSGGLSEEADTFVNANTMKSAVSSYHKFRARLVAKHALAIQTNAMIEAVGYHPSPQANKKHGFCALETFQKMVKENPQTAFRVLQLCAEISEDGAPIPISVMRGLYALTKRLEIGDKFLFEPRHVSRLRETGMEALAAAVQREKHINGQGGPLIEARAIHKILNHKLKNRIEMKP